MVPMRADLEVLQGDHSRRLDDSQGAFILPIVDGVISGQYFAPFNTLVSPPFRLSMCSAQRVYPWARFPINSSAQPQSPKNAPRFPLIVLAHNNRRYEHPLAGGPGLSGRGYVAFPNGCSRPASMNSPSRLKYPKSAR